MPNNEDYPPVIFVLGPPCAGKTYLCERAAKEIPGIKHVVVSDLLCEYEQEFGSLYAPYVYRKRPSGTLIRGEIAVAVVKNLLDSLSQEGKPPTVLLDGFPQNIEQARMFKKQIGAVRRTIFLTCLPEVTAIRRWKRGRNDDIDPTVAANRYQGYQDKTRLVIEYLNDTPFRVETICTDKDGDEGWLSFRNIVQGH